MTRLRNLFVAGWADFHGAGGSSVPLPFADAVAWLRTQLERNTDRWPYADAVLDALNQETGETVINTTDHSFYLRRVNS